ncbi:membrane protein insertase YidC [Microbacterium sp. M3]|uniref:Membrane protein insertase YidC n=1 Tax=Microbacterium arthrosphaerae TaxID=792652 RepID=A0ABU4H329_9MICO|nr:MULTISPECIES: membrane protein insertase YidC [Microbacterium]MDW4573741.1 membrane protein insertase YidC [Microbacterium arthrosphaerae]MDW7607596.1 membrane protein insertase YidC [Microbacterium sp. M3]
MDLFTFPPIAALLDGAYTFLLWLAALLEPVAGSAAAAASVILLTVLVRVALVPVGVAQAKAEQMRSRLAPRLRELQRRHRRDPERLQSETMKLYADENASPLAGCLPMLAQAPVVGIVYALFLHTSIAGHANTLLTEQLLGVPLGASLVGAIAGGTATAATWGVFAGVLVLIVVVAELTRRAFRLPVDRSADASSLAGAGVARLAGALQFTTAVVAVFVPLAAALYLAVTVAWTFAQRLLLRRRYPLAPT